MGVQTIKNPLIQRIHSVFRDLREVNCNFFNARDENLIRFNFGESPTFWQFRVKFTSTHKMLKFIVAKDGDQSTIDYSQLEKTRNIILDIDRLYHQRHRDYITVSDQLRDRLQKLFIWGMRLNKNRKNEIFKAKALPIPPVDQRNTMTNEEVLYYGVVTGCWVISRSDDVVRAEIQLLGGNQYTIDCDPALVETIYNNRILLVNWLGRFNVLSFTSAQHHLDLTEAQRNEISAYLATQKEAA